MLRVVVVDDQSLVRTGFRLVLQSEPGIEVVGEAEDGVGAVQVVRENRPDVILMDVRMPRMDGIESTRRILALQLQPPPHIVMLTTFDMDEYVYEAFKAGASGFLLKDVSPERLVEAIRAVASGDTLLSPAVTRRLVESFLLKRPPTPKANDAAASLTAREQEVLRLVARGLTNAEIAHELVVSEATVKTHVASVLGKLGLRDRVQAVVFAYEHDIVRAGEQ
ncbi:MAG: response regulator [Tepidiformaceae bacterium]